MARGLLRTAFDQASYDYWTGQYGVVNVRDYGAVGNGVHDDWQAFQNAIQVAKASARKIILAPGNYYCSQGITLPVSLEGTSPENTIITFSSSVGNAGEVGISFIGQHQSLRGVTVQFDAYPTGGYLLTTYTPGGAQSARQCIIDQVFWRTFYNAVEISYSAEIWMTNQDARDYPGGGAAWTVGTVGASNDIYFNRCISDQTAGANPAASLLLTAPPGSTGANGIWVSDCDFLHAVNGVKVLSPAGSTIQWLFFNQVASDSAANDCWYFAGDGAIEGVSVTSCWGSSASNNGMEIFSANSLVVNGGQFYKNGNSGIVIQASGSNGPGGSNISILGAQIAGNGIAGNGVGAVTVNQGPATIEGCIIGEMAGFDNTQAWAVVIQASGVLVAYNTFLANQEGTITLTSAGATDTSLIGNVGFNDLINTTAGETAGTLYATYPEWGKAIKKMLVIVDSYENDTSTGQTLTYPFYFTYPPAVTVNTTGLTVSATTGGLTITAPDNTTTYSGVIEIVGF